MLKLAVLRSIGSYWVGTRYPNIWAGIALYLLLFKYGTGNHRLLRQAPEKKCDRYFKGTVVQCSIYNTVANTTSSMWENSARSYRV